MTLCRRLSMPSFFLIIMQLKKDFLDIECLNVLRSHSSSVSGAGLQFFPVFFSFLFFFSHFSLSLKSLLLSMPFLLLYFLWVSLIGLLLFRIVLSGSWLGT